MNRIKSYSVISLCLILFGFNPKSYCQTVNEYLLKSIQLYKICKYTEWPAEKNASATFVIYVLGTPAETKNIDIPKNKTINNKPVEVISIQDYTHIKNGMVLFVCKSQSNQIPLFLDFVNQKNILLVSDVPGVTKSGVMVNFYVENEQIGFELNLIAINNSRIKLHSQLYTIGKIINNSN